MQINHALSSLVQQTEQLSSRTKDYIEITKPKVVLLILLTALVGMLLALPQFPEPLLIIASLTGIGLLSSAAAAINHLVDYRIDVQMARTKNRPVAKGRVTQSQAFIFAGVIGFVGYAILYLAVNPLTAHLTLASLVGYAVVYTLYLKRATPQNIVIGGLAGAMPPLLGWTSVTNQIDPNALLLVIIIFTWTPPHFWALAIHRQKDYARAKVPMLPVTHGLEFTKTMVLLYSALQMIVGLFPWLFGLSGVLYLLGSTILNGYFLYLAWQLKFNDSTGLAFKVFKFSIFHLMLLFIVLLVDHSIITIYESQPY
ncbi:protoheme IX farnesyltransferase [Saccharobesus litoralis]|uniref:Protoheme IX farnesyltransferase n=1 Tax=Saccharobesus litoralis TaxID=2172099 RepID=A0A2S0VR69_9ALTE|nr:heme o synthase [Saccharobesus litoralis]AWB66694.1 protoheme IX farnesyltransferase [Saccharobesus litoralis]